MIPYETRRVLSQVDPSFNELRSVKIHDTKDPIYELRCQYCFSAGTIDFDGCDL